MNLWHFDKGGKIAGAHWNLTDKSDAISGNCTNVWGSSLIGGDVSKLCGCLTGLTGCCRGLIGDVSHLHGDISGISGQVDARLIGDVSGLTGDVSGVWGKADGLRGSVIDLLEQGSLWPVHQPFSLEMFASRYNLPMEFLDNSGSPALIAFYALEGESVHWVAVSSSRSEGFTVGSLSSICRHFPGQEIIKVAVPSDAEWHLLEDFDLLCVEKIYAFEQMACPVDTAMN